MAALVAVAALAAVLALVIVVSMPSSDLTSSNWTFDKRKGKK